MYRAVVTLVAAIIMVAGTAGAALACGHGNPPKPTEVSVCWQMVNPDFTNPNSFEWPQVFVAEGTASDTADTLCPGVPPCSTDVKYQFDKYYLDNQSDRAYLDQIEASGISSPNDDARLSPHDYSALIRVSDQTGCNPPPPPKMKHAHIRFEKTNSCRISQRFVHVVSKTGIALVNHRHSANRRHWTFWGHTKKGYRIGGKIHFRYHFTLRHVGKCHAPHPGSG